MKYIKTYEELKKYPQIGDYIAIKLPIMVKPSKWNKDLFPKNEIYKAKIINKRGNIYQITYLGSKFKAYYDHAWWVTRKEIIDFSRDSRDLDYIFDVNKYNL